MYTFPQIINVVKRPSTHYKKNCSNCFIQTYLDIKPFENVLVIEGVLAAMVSMDNLLDSLLQQNLYSIFRKLF